MVTSLGSRRQEGNPAPVQEVILHLAFHKGFRGALAVSGDPAVPSTGQEHSLELGTQGILWEPLGSKVSGQFMLIHLKPLTK